MFENLQNKIAGIFDKLKGKGVIDNDTLSDALREIRVALLESDVSISVAKDDYIFILARVNNFGFVFLPLFL